MNMAPGSCRIWRITPEDDGKGGWIHYAFVTADMLEFGRTWPTVVQEHDPKFRGMKFKFVCNEVMEDFMVGNYSGHAKYVEIREETTQSAESNK